VFLAPDFQKVFEKYDMAVVKGRISKPMKLTYTLDCSLRHTHSLMLVVQECAVRVQTPMYVNFTDDS
jgi:hypothetical protein